MNEKLVKQVLDIEKQAEEAYKTALDEANEIPLQAEQESQQIIEKARAEAEEQARQMIESAQSEEETERIMSDANEKARRTEAVAKSNFERAVLDVLYRVVGKE